jgi:hypothetical protein
MMFGHHKKTEKQSAGEGELGIAPVLGGVCGFQIMKSTGI